MGATIVINLAFQYQSLPVMAGCRFLLGFFGRMIVVSNYWWIYQTSLPSQKSRILSFPLLTYSSANIIMYIVSLHDDEGPYF